MLEDTMESLDDDDLEEEADSEVDKVLYELTAGMEHLDNFDIKSGRELEDNIMYHIYALINKFVTNRQYSPWHQSRLWTCK